MIYRTTAVLWLLLSADLWLNSQRDWISVLFLLALAIVPLAYLGLIRWRRRHR